MKSELEFQNEQEQEPWWLTTKTKIAVDTRELVRRIAKSIDDNTSMIQETHANSSKSEKFMHSLANIFKFGAGEAEKTYPSKKK